MQLYIKNVSGMTHIIEANPSDTVKEVKNKHWSLYEGPPPDQQRLIFNGTALTDDKTLADFNIGNQATLHLVL